tara:strand:+ start:4482 stop:6440 length:1959 start_codon:yes stop_codon:yes gene_type:complete
MAVTNFTADAIGDYFFAKLQEPYSNVTRVLSWNILVGVNSPNSVGTLDVVSGSNQFVGSNVNLNLSPGNKFIIGGQVFTVHSIQGDTITSVETSDFTATGAKWYEYPDLDNYFTYEFRYSQEAAGTDGGQMSELRPLNNSIGPRDLLGIQFDSTKPLWIDVKAEAYRLSSLHSLSLLSVTFELETADGTIQSCPQLCGDCNDPYLPGCTNIVIDCSDPIYDPYSLSKPTAIYEEISELSANMWGHPVQYFRVEPDKRSKDVVLMEYSLYNVKEQGNLKIMVPDNEMPTREFTYDIFGMGFEDFEIHVTKGQMEAAFGEGIHPRPRDYMYIPRMNRMYEVSSVSLADEFNQNMTYWRVMLQKYEERSSTQVEEGSAIETALDDLYTGVEEVFGEEQRDEYEKTTKSTQYQTVFSEVGDGVRDRIHNNLTISDKEIRNKWTIIAKNSYDLESVKDLGIECLLYRKYSQLAVDGNLAFTTWFKPNLTSATAEQTIFDGWQNNKGLKLTVNQTHVKAYINDLVLTYPFATGLGPVNGNWYGMVYNLNNSFLNTGAYVYKLNPQSNALTSMPVSDTLTEVMHENFELASAQGWSTKKQWSLMPGKLAMTNIRLFKKTIGQDQHTNVLQQYIVRDSHLALITDNAVPSIQLRKYNQNR